MKKIIIKQGDENENQLIKLIHFLSKKNLFWHMNKLEKPHAKENLYKEKFSIQLKNEDFRKDISELRVTSKMPSLGFNSVQGAVHWAKDKTPTDFKNFQTKIKELRKKHSIGSRWTNIITYFIFFNKNASAWLLPKLLDIEIQPNSDAPIHIVIHRDTTGKDVMRGFHEVELYKQLLYGDKIYTKEMEELKGAIFSMNKKGSYVVKSKARDIRQTDKFKDYEQAKIANASGVRNSDTAKQLGFSSTEGHIIGTYIAKYKKIIQQNILP